MPEADTFDAPDGAALHGELLETLTEAFVGNGITQDGDAEVTADAGTAMGIDVAAATGGISYSGTVYTPTAASFTLSTGPTSTTGGQDDRRVDLVYFDSSTGAYATSEGTPAPNPSPDPTPADSLLIALVLVDHEATDLQDADILNWRAHAKPGVVAPNGEAEFADGLHVGRDPTDTITETSTPTGFTFSADDGRDVWLEADVTVSNNSGASATEDVTLNLYDGTSSGDPQVATDTQSSGSVADGDSTTLTLITTDQKLDGGDFFVEVTTSGTDLTVDEVVVKTQGLEWSFVENDDGTLDLVNRYTGSSIFTVDSFTDEIAFLNAAIDEPEIADGSITTSKLADDAATAAKIAADAITNEQVADDAITDTEIGDLAAGIASVLNPGAFGALFDVPVDGTSPDDTTHSYTFDIDGNSVLEIRGLSDGAGGVDNLEARLHQTVNLNGNDVVDGATTYIDVSAGHVPRPQVDDELVSAAVQTGAYTTSGEEVIPVNPSGTGGVTITLATADANDGNRVHIIDVNGSAQTDNITVATEGSETIGGETSDVIDDDYGSIVVQSDGTDWFVRSKTSSVNRRNIFEGAETGNVPAGDQGVLIVDNLAPGESVEVYKVALTTDTVEAVATGVDLELVTFDNAGGFTSQATLAAGDGSTVHDRVTGNPLASYTNSGTSGQSIGVLVDNTLTSAVDVVAKVEGEAPV